MPVNKPLEERFWPKVNKNSGHFGIDGTFSSECWEWIAGDDGYGYGAFWDPKSQRMLKASRVSWKLHFGRIPKKKCVLHKCDNPPCIRPDHLFIGTKTENMLDKVRKGRAQRGEQITNSKLKEWQILEIRKLAKQGYTQAKIAEMFDVVQKTISYIVNYKHWKHIP